MIDIEVKIEGAEQLKGKLSKGKLISRAMHHILSKASSIMVRGAKINTPVDTGRLRSGYTQSVDSSFVPTWARVANPVKYGAPLEYSGKKPRRTGRIPFFGPAIETMRSKFNGLIEEAKQMIERQWGV